MDLEFATEFFDQFINFERHEIKRTNVRLETIKLLCDYFGYPELACPCFHVAGSKGKGSVTTMIGSILKSAGFKTVGLYRSPELTHFTDRISEASGPFPLEVYQNALSELKSGVEELKKEGKLAHPTWYELVTIYAFLTFRAAGCDYAVFEVGAGGRLDATNVVKPTSVVINTIELEHTEFLGDTLEKIAAEKAGIIKRNIPVVIGPQKTESVKNVFRKVAREKQAGELVFLPDKLETDYYLDDDKHLKMRICTLGADLKLPGDFQALNALAAATAVRLAFPAFPDETIKSGLSSAYLPGRFEIKTSRELLDYPQMPYLVLDCAHTENSVSGTVSTLETYRHLLAKQKTYDSCLTDFTLGEKPILLFACAKRKNVEAMAQILKPHFSKIILTKPGDFKTPDLPRAKAAFQDATLIEDYHQAIKTAFETANSSSRALVALGSCYLVSEVKKFLEKEIPW